jgi:hypothetical protein
MLIFIGTLQEMHLILLPNRLMVGWDAMNKTSNPMKSIPVNDLIKKIKKKEVQKQQGKKSMARHGLVAAEFEQTLDLLEENNDQEEIHGLQYSKVNKN